MGTKLLNTILIFLISQPAVAVWYTSSTTEKVVDLAFRNKVETLTLAVCLFLMGISLIDLVKENRIKDSSIRFLILSATAILVLTIFKLTY